MQPPGGRGADRQAPRPATGCDLQPIAHTGPARGRPRAIANRRHHAEWRAESGRTLAEPLQGSRRRRSKGARLQASGVTRQGAVHERAHEAFRTAQKQRLAEPGRAGHRLADAPPRFVATPGSLTTPIWTASTAGSPAPCPRGTPGAASSPSPAKSKYGLPQHGRQPGRQ